LPVTEEWSGSIFTSEARFAYHLSPFRLAKIDATFDTSAAGTCGDAIVAATPRISSPSGGRFGVAGE
jgi:hypothetical protein